MVVREELVEMRTVSTLTDEDLLEEIRRVGYNSSAAPLGLAPEHACAGERETAMEGVCLLEIVRRGLEDRPNGRLVEDEDLVEKIRRFGFTYRKSHA
jgi:hypothetical protein